jgi:DNA-binding transcriptional LysR family regulator
MERTLGLRLLDRGRNGIEPTAYGRALVKRGLIIFDELKQGVEELEFLADPSIGSLRIGSTESIAAGMLPAIIERFWRDYPGVRLDVAQTVISTLHYRELRERSIDLLIGRIPTPFTVTIRWSWWRGGKANGRARARSSSPISAMNPGFCRQPIRCPDR